MAAKHTTFRQADVTRAIKAATAGGLKIGKVEIEPSGRIALYAGEAGKAAAETPLDKWLGKRDAGQA